MTELFLTTSSMNTEPVVTSLPGAASFHYDRADSPPDRLMLDAVDYIKPDTVVYIGCTGGPWLPSPSTFARMRRAGRKTICLAFDASDETWHPHLAEFKGYESFDIVVNIDGNDAWPRVTDKDLTLLTPVSSHWFEPQMTWVERPIPFGFAGGYASPSRAAIVNALVDSADLVVPTRNEKYGSYREYARFMGSTRIALNVPWSGVSETQQVKGRVIEAGLAGCVLLEHRHAATKDWFEPGKDYETYATPEEAARIHGWYQARPQVAAEMAAKLRARVIAEHAPEIFWRKIFERI